MILLKLCQDMEHYYPEKIGQVYFSRHGFIDRSCPILITCHQPAFWQARVYGDLREARRTSQSPSPATNVLYTLGWYFSGACLKPNTNQKFANMLWSDLIFFFLPCKAKERIHKRGNPLKTGESQWLRKRRKLVNKAVACGGAITSEAKGASMLSAGLWGDKQKKETTLQKKRDHVNRYLLAVPQSCH